MTQQFPTFKKVGKALIMLPINIVKRTWKWSLAILLLLAVVHSFATFIYGRQVENEIAKIKAKGDPVSCAELAGKPIPDAENGAVIYEKAFKRMGGLSNISRTVDYGDILKPENQNDPKAWERAREVVQKNKDIYLLTQEAAAKPQCRFKANWQDGVNALFPYLGRVRQLAKFLAVSAMLSAKDGNADQALESIKMIYRVSDSIKDDPTLIHQLVRIATIGIADNALKEVADYSTIDASQAKMLNSEISNIDLHSGLITAFNGERLCALSAFDSIKKQDFHDLGWSPDSFLIQLRTTYLGRPLLYMDEANMLRRMNKLIDLYSMQSYIKIRREHLDFAPNENATIDITKATNLVDILMPVYYGARDRMNKGQTSLAGSQLLLALRAYNHQFGSYPQTLAELKNKLDFKVPTQDPFSGKDFIYKRQGNGFLLYSIGENMKDDGGTVPKKSYDHEHGDIVWKMSH